MNIPILYSLYITHIETCKAHSMVEAGYSVFAHDHLFHGESEPANPCHINRYVIIYC